MGIESYKKQLNQLIVEYQQKPHPHVFLQNHTDLVKEYLVKVWQKHITHAPYLTLLAIGGFGRAELYPYSDIDLAIVSTTELTDNDESMITQFLQTLWDSHLHPAPKVGSIQQLMTLAKEDITSDTAFLENNYIAGNKGTAIKFNEKLSNQRDILAFSEAKILEQRQRHIKSQTTTSALEPNIKTCSGGLRDIHTLLWLAKAQGLSVGEGMWIHEEILTKDEARLLLHSHRQLARLRIDLHLITKREEDFFVFNMQTEIAKIWGFQDTQKQIKSEQIMQVLFRAQKIVKQLNLILVPILLNRLYSPYPRIITRLEGQFQQLNSQLTVMNLSVFEKQPSYIFKVLSLIQTNKQITGFTPLCLRAIWNARRKINKKFQQNQENRQLFIQFFINGDGLTHTLKFMNLYGILARYLPQWKPIIGLMQYDLFHIYPVDDHILMVVRNLRRMAMDIHSHELPFQSELMQQFEQKHILYLAALLHDIAKGQGGDHSKQGMKIAHEFALEHNLNKNEIELLCWLVEAHLLMSHTAQKEDIQDRDVIERFGQEVKTPERLIALYLFTCADMRGTNPNIWNSWKASLLNNLYQTTLNYLQQGNSTSIQTHKNNVTTILTKEGYQLSQQKQLWHALGEPYFVRHSEADILWHVTNLIGYENQSHFSARILSSSQTLQVMVYIADRPKLFAQICQFFTCNNLDIVDAKIYTSEHQFALDTFIVQNTQFTSEELTIICRTLPQLLQHFLTTEQQTNVPINTKVSRRLKSFPIVPQITILPQEHPHFYTLEIIAGDWPGILEEIAQVLSQFSIRLFYAKIATLGERVEDNFLISSVELENPRFQLAFKEALLTVLQG